MVKCRRCMSRAVSIRISYAKLHLCETCFNSFFLQRVWEVVKKHGMFLSTDRVALAISGGKDSAVLLHSLKEVFPNVEFVPFHIDLGIGEYSQDCLEKAEALTKMVGLELFSRKNPGFKHQLLSVFLKKLIPFLEERAAPGESFNLCEICGYPSIDKICGSCEKIMEARAVIERWKPNKPSFGS